PMGIGELHHGFLEGVIQVVPETRKPFAGDCRPLAPEGLEHVVEARVGTAPTRRAQHHDDVGRREPCLRLSHPLYGPRATVEARDEASWRWPHAGVNRRPM